MLVTVRRVEPSDIPFIARIRAHSWETEPFWTDRVTRYLGGEHSPQQALPARAIFVAIDQGELVGFVAGHRTTRFNCEGELQWIDVSQDKRGLGIGNQLVETIGEWFISQNLRRVCVNVDPTNESARRLYSKRGAEPLNEHWMIWEDARKMSSLAARGDLP